MDTYAEFNKMEIISKKSKCRLEDAKSDYTVIWEINMKLAATLKNIYLVRSQNNISMGYKRNVTTK